MEDGEQISSTTPHVDELRFGDEWMADSSSAESPFYHREAEPDDDILDLAGGGKEALERHKATVQQDLESPPADLFSKPTVAEQAAPVAEPKLDTGFGFSDAGAKRTSVAEEIADTSRKPQTPKVETVSPVKDSPTASPSSHEPIFPPPAPSQPLMHSSAEDRAQPLGKEGDSSQLGSVALAPSLSPLHTPDSLEELSLSESPNQAIMSAPFGSFAAPAIDFCQKSHWDVPLSEEVKAFECLSESKLSLGTDDHSFLGVRDKEGVKASTFSPGEGDPFLSSLLTSEVDLGSKVETGKSGRCEDSGVASSPDEKLGSSGGSHDDGKTDSDKEGFDKDSESGESTGSTPTQSPVNTKVPTESFLSYAPSDPTASLDAPHFESRDIIKDVDETAKDAFVSKTSWYETDLLSSKTGMDDFLCEVKSSSAAMNPFQGFSPIDSGSGFPPFSESTSDGSDVKMCESPTPDLVQHAHDGELQDVAQIKCKEETAVDLVQMASDKPMDLPDTSVHSTLPEESKESSAPRSLPDILKSYPLSAGKVDSGSSEGSSDEHSPVQEVCADNSPLDSATDPFAFNNKALLLKEMAEETEARETAVKEQQNVEVLAEKSFGAFDLVKEVETTTKTKDSPVLETEEKSWMFSGQHSTKSEKPEALNPPDSINLPLCSPMKPSAVEESDSESPMTDSLSPVLEAMAKNPASFQIEVESKCMEELKTSPVKGIKGAYVEDHDVSEQEVSSEEFEFIERPPKGVMDEFLETLESAKFAKAPEMGTDDDASPGFGQGDLAAELEYEAAAQQSSYLLLTQPTSKASSQKLKADLENPPEPLEFERKAQESASATDVFLPRSVIEEPEKPAPSQKKVEDLPTGVTVHPEAPKATMLPRLSAEAVVDLLYWRDVKATGVVFGAHLFLLLSLTVCSIISVCSYVALALLSVTITFRIYKGILQAVQKSDEGHPFKSYLAQEVTLSEDLVHKYSDLALVHLNNTIKELRRLFLVEDLVDSLKFAVLMWILTYVGALFNGLTLLILGLIAVFSVPIIYEKHQAQIDHYLALARNQIKDVLGKIQAKIPGMKAKAE